MIREWGRSLGTAVFEALGRAVGQAQERRPLPVDVLESDDAYLAVFDAPGASASDVQVRHDAGAVEVRVERFRDFHEEFEMVFPGRGLSLDGRVTLPDGASVDADAAVATLKASGELHVRVPKGDDGRVAVLEGEENGDGAAPGPVDGPDGPDGPGGS